MNEDDNLTLNALYLIKIGEIILKKGNRREFENQLKYELKRRLSPLPNRIEFTAGRFYLYINGNDRETAESVLSRIPGINGFSRALKCEKNQEAIKDAALAVAREGRAKGLVSFKVEARRADKSYPLNSMGIATEFGEIILEAIPGMKVDVHNPDLVVAIEIREKAFVYGFVQAGQKGLPVGVSGTALLLLSGGIDSPVAGWMMAKRGLSIHALYFHAYPYTSVEALEKVKALARILSSYSGRLNLHVAPFTEVQLAIKRGARTECTTLYMRAAMMELSHRLAMRLKANCLITGESLGQVASQTAENLRFTESFTSLPVLRPLIGTDKEDTIKMARAIGSFETSILPYEDCCVLFSPEHPVLKADYERERSCYSELKLDSLIEESLAALESFHFGY